MDLLRRGEVKNAQSHFPHLRLGKNSALHGVDRKIQ